MSAIAPAYAGTIVPSHTSRLTHGCLEAQDARRSRRNPRALPRFIASTDSYDAASSVFIFGRWSGRNGATNRKGARMSQRNSRSMALHLGLGVVVASLTVVAVYTSGVSTIRIEDRCDPASFNAAVRPGTCVQDGGTTFDEFIAELRATGVAEHWRFKEEEVHIRARRAGKALTNERWVRPVAPER